MNGNGVEKLTTRQAQRLLREEYDLQRTTRSLIRWIVEGKIVGEKVGEGRGGIWLLERPSLEEYVRERFAGEAEESKGG